MIWQTLSMIIAGMAVNKTLPETQKQFIDKIVDTAAGIIDYPKEDIIAVLKTIEFTEFTEFAQIMCSLYTNENEKQK